MNRRGITVGTGVLLGIVAFVGSGSLADPPEPSAAVTTAPPPASSPSTTTGEVEPPPPPPTTTTTTTTTAATRQERERLVIHGTGDVVFDPGYIPRFASEGYSSAFDGLGGVFLQDDLTIVNLECAPSMLGRPLDKDFVFRCPPSTLGVLARNGVDVVNLANNHSQDYGQDAMLDGALQASLAGLSPVGVGSSIATATRPALFDVGGWRIAVLGMGGVVPGWGWLATDTSPGMASGDDIEQMTAAVEAAGELADLVLVTIHWGVELESAPRPEDIERARAMIAAGADAVFGHHPHRLGDVDFIDGRPVFWTLGNFIWPKLSEASATTGIARLEISPDGEIGACILPAFIERSGQPVLTGPTECGSMP